MRALFLLFILLHASVCLAQANMCAVLDSIVRTMQRISFYNTYGAQERIAKLDLSGCAQADSLHELAPQLTAVMNALGDHHGRIMLDWQPLAWMSDATYTNNHDTRSPDQAFWSEVQRGRYGFEASMRGKNVGYLRIPAVNGGDVQQIAKKFRHSLDSLLALGADRWIIDLRVNSGGNMWPMLEALAPLFPPGRAATTIDRHDGMFASYDFRDGHFERNAYRMIELPSTAFLFKDPVVVLMGRYTASSGEAVAACFVNRPNTTSIGEATADYATETGWVTVYDRVLISIAESVFCNLEGHQYRHGFIPTVVIPQPAPGFDNGDPAIKAALDQLNER
ncbi:MAG: S41 family peptidase [Flavobacteriales bacterium]|nr:S41 family peptidase [Flavobacteriales bacterium]